MTNPNEQIQKAIQLFESGKLAECEDLLRRVLEAHPDHPDGLHLLGLIAHSVGQRELALQLINAAIARQPNTGLFYSNYALVLQAMQRLDEAMGYARQAIALGPQESNFYFNLGGIMQAKGQMGEAAALYEKSIALNPSLAAAYNNLGSCYQLSFHLKEAIECYHKALAISPKSGWENNLAIAYRDQARIDESLEAHERAMRLDEKDAIVHMNMLRTLHFWEHYDAADCSAKHIAWGRRFAGPFYSKVKPHENDRNPDRQLRVGFVSGDFRSHAVAVFLEPLMAHLNRSQFQIYSYANEVVPDVATKRFMELSNAWRDITGIPDDNVAEMIRNDRIDILVDMAGLTAGNRILVFARKPAPVQISWLGYQDTTGVETIDYRVTDSICDPPGVTDKYYTEKLLRMPEIFACYGSPANVAEVNALPALTNGYVTFASLNNYGKVSPRVVATWSEILKRVPTSRLLLFIPGAEKCAELVRPRFEAQGIPRQRLQLVDRQPYKGYREQFQTLDIAFDPFPCSGHTTMCDGLWGGVPSITLEGDSYVSRMGTSVLKNIGLPEFIAHSTEEYIEIAVKWAGELSRLAELRSTLRQRFSKSPVADHPRFTRNTEVIYRDVWRKWCSNGA